MTTKTNSGHRKKRGPIARPGRVRVTVYLDAETAEWGKHQGTGLSDLVRQLLIEAQVRVHSGGSAAPSRDSGMPTTDPYSPELRETYRRLIDRKLRAGLSLEDEGELARTRERINDADRGRMAERDRGATAIEQELLDLRREIEAFPKRS